MLCVKVEKEKKGRVSHLDLILMSEHSSVFRCLWLLLHEMSQEEVMKHRYCIYLKDPLLENEHACDGLGITVEEFYHLCFMERREEN